MKQPHLASSPHTITTAALLAAATLLPLSAIAADWTGTAGDNDFSNAANWGGTEPNGNILTINDSAADIALSSSVSPSNLYLQNGTVTQTSGALSVGGWFRVGSGASNGSSGTATYNMTGGTISSTGNWRIGLYGGTGTVNLSNGASVTTSGNLNIGAGGDSVNSASAGILSLDGASTSFTVNNTADTAVSLGNWTNTGTGTLEVKNGATFATTGQIAIGVSSSTAKGIINLSNGGTISANKFWKNASNTAEFNVNGGTLQVRANQGNFLENLEVNLLAGGVTIDTNGFDAANITDTSKASKFTGVGGLTKTGSGTFTLNRDHDYTGATKVNEGTLVIGGSITSAEVRVANGASLELTNASALLSSAAVYLDSNASLILNAANGDVITFNELFVNGTHVAAGTYDLSEAIWNDFYDSFGIDIYSSTGVTLVVSIPEPSTYALLGSAGLFSLVILRRRRSGVCK